MDNAVALFSKRGTTEYAEKWEYKLNFTVRPFEALQKRGVGYLSEVFYDRIFFIRTVDPETYDTNSKPAKQTAGPIVVVLYMKAPLEYVLGVFSNYNTAKEIAGIANGLLAPEPKGLYDGIHGVRFLIDQKEQEIRAIPSFSNVSELRVEEVNDSHIDSVWLKGSKLDESAEWNKYVTDDISGGRIRFLTLSYKDRNYYILDDGRIFTRQGTDARDDYVLMYELVSLLNGVDAVKF
ncbi:MAG: hypothetical protein OK442_06890 [Thaumarchaeota archaeon]|nr:hypothetical protein [Nitrososphaerota archaeon]